MRVYCCTRKILKETETEQAIGFLSSFVSLIAGLEKLLVFALITITNTIYNLKLRLFWSSPIFGRKMLQKSPKYKGPRAM